MKNVKTAVSNVSNDPTTKVTVMKNPSKTSKKAKTIAETTPADVAAAKATKTPAEIVAERIASVSTEPSVSQNLPAKAAPTGVVVSALSIAIRDARVLHRRMKVDFIDGIAQIAKQVIAAKHAAKKEGVSFESLFGNPDDESKFPFSQNWANTIVRVYESKLLSTSDVARLPADLTTLATLASTKPDKRDEVLKRYEEIRTGDYNVIEGEVIIGKVTTQKAMKKAKAEVDGGDEGTEKDVTPKKPKEFNATRMAKLLLRELGPEGLSELADAIELVLEEEGVR